MRNFTEVVDRLVNGPTTIDVDARLQEFLQNVMRLASIYPEAVSKVSVSVGKGNYYVYLRGPLCYIANRYGGPLHPESSRALTVINSLEKAFTLHCFGLSWEE
jgi:hypothetical protein